MVFNLFLLQHSKGVWHILVCNWLMRAVRSESHDGKKGIEGVQEWFLKLAGSLMH